MGIIMMKSENKLLFILFVAFCLLLPSSEAEEIETTKLTLPSEGGNILIPNNNPIGQKSENEKKELNKDVQKHDEEKEDERKNISTGLRSIMPDSLDISGSTGISVLLFVCSLLVVFFIMYRACR